MMIKIPSWRSTRWYFFTKIRNLFGLICFSLLVVQTFAAVFSKDLMPEVQNDNRREVEEFVDRNFQNQTNLTQTTISSRQNKTNYMLLTHEKGLFKNEINESQYGPPIVRPKFVVNTGDPNSNKYFKKNKQSLLSHIEQAIDAGCMKGWEHNQDIFLQFGE